MLLAFPLLFSPYSDFSCKNNLRAIFPDYAGRYNTLTISKQQSRVESHIDKKEKTVTTTGFYKSGMRKYLKDYKDEKEHGLWVEWYPNGKMKISKKFLVGKENGPWTEWSEDGKITFQGNFKDGNEQ